MADRIQSRPGAVGLVVVLTIARQGYDDRGRVFLGRGRQERSLKARSISANGTALASCAKVPCSAISFAAARKPPQAARASAAEVEQIARPSVDQAHGVAIDRAEHVDVGAVLNDDLDRVVG